MRDRPCLHGGAGAVLCRAGMPRRNGKRFWKFSSFKALWLEYDVHSPSSSTLTVVGRRFAQDGTAIQRGDRNTCSRARSRLRWAQTSSLAITVAVSARPCRKDGVRALHQEFLRALIRSPGFLSPNAPTVVIGDNCWAALTAVRILKSAEAPVVWVQGSGARILPPLPALAHGPGVQAWRKLAETAGVELGEERAELHFCASSGTRLSASRFGQRPFDAS